MEHMKITLPYPPSVNNLYATVRGRRIKSSEGNRFEQAAQNEANKHFDSPLTGEIVLRFDVYMPRKSDLDNRIKATQDALTGVAFKSDIQVCEIHAYRRKDPNNPRVEVTILEVSA